MTNINIRSWLEELGLGKYKEVFEKNEIDGEVVPQLTEQDIRELGLPVGPRRKLLNAIQALKQDSFAYGGTEVRATSSSLLPHHYVPPHLAERMRNAREAVEGERKQVTILFADIKGSTALVDQLDPEQASKLLHPVLQAMMSAVHRYEGTVNRVQGDGLMAMFGAPLAHEDHAVRACYAALAMQQAVRGLDQAGTEDPAQLRVGLHSGEVVVRAINNDLSVNYDALGVTAHLAARMEQVAAPGSIRITADTMLLVEGFVEAEALGRQRIKGIAEPLAVFELKRATAARTRWQASLSRGLSPLVGRVAVLGALNRALTQAGGGDGQLAAVVGEAGVGKSRLIYELLQGPATEGWQVLSGSSVSYGKASNWLPVIELLRGYFDIDEHDDATITGAKIRAQLRTLDEGLEAHATVFLAMFDFDVEDPLWHSLDALQKRRRTLDTLQALFVRESQRQPLLLVFEDLHWIDWETQTLLNELVEQLPGNRLLLFVNYRPEYTHNWGSRSYYAQHRLDPLTLDSAGELLDCLLGDDASLAAVKQQLIDRAAGNPLFLEEGVRSLVETGALSGAPGAYSLTRHLVEISLPATIQALIAERIDCLAPPDKELLQTASVIGTLLPYQLLASVAGVTEESLQRSLGVLQATEFIYPTQLFPEVEYRLKHAHTQHVAYSSLLNEQRQRLHAQAADALQALYPERLQEMIEKLAEHCEKAERWEQAVDFYIQAAEKSKRKHAHRRAFEYVGRALTMTEKGPSRPEQQARAMALLGDLASLTDDLEGANAHYEQAANLATDKRHKKHILNRIHRQRFTERDGARLAFYEHGTAGEPLVLTNPVAYRVAAFQPILEALCQDFRVITMDPRGTGASDPIESLPYPFGERDHDLHAVINALNAGPVVAVGVSWSSNTLIRLACNHPELFKKLMLIGTPPHNQTDTKGPFFDEPYKRLLDPIMEGDFTAYERLIREFAYRIYSEAEVRDSAERYVKDYLALPREVVVSHQLPDPEKNVISMLGELKVPTLVAQGTADRMIPFEAARFLVERIHGAQLYAFEGKGHIPMFTAKQEFCEVLRHFVRTGKAPQRAITS